MPDLNALVIYATVVESNSFSEASRRLNIPVSTVSRRIADLERELGVQLLERSTRKLRLTEIGLEVYKQAEASLELNDAVHDIVNQHFSGRIGNVAYLLAAEYLRLAPRASDWRPSGSPSRGAGTGLYHRALRRPHG